MKLTVLAANQTKVEFNNGVVVFFSYNTPVAIHTSEGAMRTSTKYSNTTSKHLAQMGFPKGTTEVSQDYIDTIVGGK